MINFFRKYKFYSLTFLYIVILCFALFFYFIFFTEIENEFQFRTKKGLFNLQNNNGIAEKFNKSLFSNFKKIKFFLIQPKQSDFKFETVSLYIPNSSSSKLFEDLPDSGFKSYQPGYLFYDSKIQNVDIRLRGDFSYHYAHDKKSLRIKTKKKSLYRSARKINFINPKFIDQLNNIVGYQVARDLGLLAPESFPVRVNINDKYNGLYYYLEQVDESFLRNRNLMPGDIYVGENVGTRDGFVGLYPNHMKFNGTLFVSPDYWHKASINNHFDDSNKKPLEKLINLTNSNTYDSIENLSSVLDLESWATFAIYRSLIKTYHFDRAHNWKLYYDPWKQKFFPIVWDPVSFAKGWLNKEDMIDEEFYQILQLKFDQVLFQNGDFLDIYFRKIDEIINNGQADLVERNVDKLVENFIYESKFDPNLRPFNVSVVENNIRDFQSNFKKNIDSFTKQNQEIIDDHLNFYQDSKNSIVIFGINKSTYNKFNIYFKNFSNNVDNVEIHKTHFLYDKRKTFTTSILPQKLSDKSISFNYNYLPNIQLSSDYKKIARNQKKITKLLEFKNSSLRIIFNDDVEVEKVSLEKNNGKFTLEKKNNFSSNNAALYHYTYPVLQNSNDEIELSGNLYFDKNHTFDNRVVIKPGTKIFLGNNVSLIFRNSVYANGTKDLPIIIRDKNGKNNFWGTFSVVNSKEAIFNYVHFSNGSGFKSLTEEYSGMLSLHNIDKFLINNCKFEDSFVVDDMVHIVYSKGKILNSDFKNSLSDAIDIDISKVLIDNINVHNSGNDGLDLMSSDVSVLNSVITSSGDKGISVGEKSYLIANKIKLTKNINGIQVKDQSRAFLNSSVIQENDTNISAYKKNWRYEKAGKIIILNSVISDTDKISLKNKSYLYTDSEGLHDGKYILNSKKINNVEMLIMNDVDPNDDNFFKKLDIKMNLLREKDF